MSEQDQQHYRMWLHNFVNGNHLGELVYSDEEFRQQQTWVSTVQLNGTTIGRGEANKKKGARENAARQALEYLQTQHGN